MSERLTPREEFEDRFGSITDDQWQWLKEFLLRQIPSLGPPQFKFKMRVALADTEGYYITRWDQAKPVTARGATEQEAINSVAKTLGKPPRGRYWEFQVDNVTEVAR